MTDGAKRPQPVFFYDLACPDCYLAAERVSDVLEVVPEWEPVLLGGIDGAGSVAGFRCQAERDVFVADVERRAGAQGAQALRWPDPWPPDGALAARVATYAKQIGRGVAFSLAAFRQAFAAGRDLDDADTVLIAAAACEMHPRAVLAAEGGRTVAAGLDVARARAGAAGVTALPALTVGEQCFQGPDSPELAAAAARCARAQPAEAETAAA